VLPTGFNRLSHKRLRDRCAVVVLDFQSVPDVRIKVQWVWWLTASEHRSVRFDARKNVIVSDALPLE
jgi:hypothetical protein